MIMVRHKDKKPKVRINIARPLQHFPDRLIKIGCGCCLMLALLAGIAWIWYEISRFVFE